MRCNKRHCDVNRGYRGVRGKRATKAQKSPTARQRKNSVIGFGSAPSGCNTRSEDSVTTRWREAQPDGTANPYQPHDRRSHERVRRTCWPDTVPAQHRHTSTAPLDRPLISHVRLADNIHYDIFERESGS